MEHPNNIDSQIETPRGPSKQFVIRGGITAFVIIFILVAQTQWFTSIFQKKNKSAQDVAGSEKTIQEVLQKDSNGNTIPDWEERLWGLDPTVLTTNGVSNKKIIEEKRSSLAGNTEAAEKLNETDKIARDLFTFSAALGQEEGIGRDDLTILAGKLASEGPSKNTVPLYTVKNIKTVPTTTKSLSSYKEALSVAIKTYNDSLPGIDVLISGLENEDYSELSSLDQTISFYTTFSKKLLSLSVPIGVLEYHLSLVNGVRGIATSFEKIKLFEENGINALVGVAEYRHFDAQVIKATDDITTYLEQYGIL